MNNPLQQLRAEFQQEITALRAEVQALQATVNLLAAPASRPKPALPIPTKFDGKAPRFKTWLPTIKAKIRVDGQAIGDNVARFYFI